MPTNPSARPRKRLRRPRTSERPSSADTAVNATIVSAKYSAGRSGAPPMRAWARRTSTQSSQAFLRRTIRPPPWSALRPASLASHHVPVDGGGNGSGFAGRIQQDAGGRAAVHRTVIDAAKHDEGADRIQAEGNREQHCHRSAGPIPGSTPTAVPSVTPASAHARCGSVIAFANPAPSADRIPSSRQGFTSVKDDS